MSLDGGAGSQSSDNRRFDPFKQYPHPFFDMSLKYTPTTVKEMYRWAQFIYQTNPIFQQIVRKLAGYVTTDIIINSKNEAAVDQWDGLLNGQLQYKRFEKRMLLDRYVFGNAYAMFLWPTKKYLRCAKCKKESALNSMNWKFEDFKFVGTCPDKNCKHSGPMKPIEKKVTSRKKIKLLRIDPRLISPIYEPVTDSYTYTYNIPKSVAAVLRSSTFRREHMTLFLENLPLAVIEAVKTNTLVKFDEGQIFHMKADSISQDDASLGEIPFMPIFKTIWLYQTIWRAQEAVSLERILPWTALSPRATATADPISSINLDEWNQKMTGFIDRWRRDPNFIGLMPYPMDVVNLRGEGKAIDNWEGLTHLRDVMGAGMGVPPSFLFGGSVYSGANVELRVLENDMRNDVMVLDDMLKNFVVPKLRSFARMPKAEIRHEDFKMADDVQQKGLIVSLRSEGVVSDETLLSELGLNHDAEKEKIRAEQEEKRSQQIQMQREQQELQLEFMKKQAELTEEIQNRQMQTQANMQMQMQQQQMGMQQEANMQEMQAQQAMGMDAAVQQNPDAVPPAGQRQQPQGGQPGMALPKAAASPMLTPQDIRTPDLAEMQARAWLANYPPAQREVELQQLARTDPELAKLIKNKMSRLEKEQKEANKPMNEVRPPSGKNATI